MASYDLLPRLNNQFLKYSKWLDTFSLVWFLFNGISTFVGYFNAKAILLEEQLWYY